jgi:hypothetical protein
MLKTFGTLAFCFFATLTLASNGQDVKVLLNEANLEVELLNSEVLVPPEFGHLQLTDEVLIYFPLDGYRADSFVLTTEHASYESDVLVVG